jgi:hypothetical protein
MPQPHDAVPPKHPRAVIRLTASAPLTPQFVLG